MGDLLVKKLIGKPKEIPEEQLTKKIKDIIPGEFTQTRTEKYTIESPFEKPEKDLIGKPVALSLDEHDSISLRKERAYSFGIPKEVTSYKLKAANKEELKVERARYVIENFEFRLDKFNEQIMERHIQSPLSLPLELSLGPDHLLRSVYSKTDISADILDLDMQQGLQEEHFRDEPGKQAEGELQIP